MLTQSEAQILKDNVRYILLLFWELTMFLSNSKRRIDLGML